MNKILVGICLISSLLLFSCAEPGSDAVIADIRQLPQTVFAYLTPDEMDRHFIPEEIQREESARFLDRHFAPWKKEIERGEKEAFWFVRWARGRSFFHENLRQGDGFLLEQLIRKADLKNYPSRSRKAIALENISLRALPSDRPFFLDPAEPGEGYPFDYMQSTMIPAGTPLLLTHCSLGGDWFFAETPIAGGWVRANAVAAVDSTFLHKYQARPMAVLIQDDLPVSDTAGIYRFTGKIGTLYPLEQVLPEGFRILVPAADADGNAVLRKADLRVGQAAIFPLAGTVENLATVGDAMMGQPYGWGGLLGNRDCSATLRDLYAPFGIWLPRNSGKQAESGRVISLKDLTPEKKEMKILSEGVPLRTLLWKPGHIALYLGIRQGKAVILHDFWGVHAESSEIHPGRHIVGHTAITTLEPGKELPGHEGSFLQEIQSMTLLNAPR